MGVVGFRTVIASAAAAILSVSGLLVPSAAAYAADPDGTDPSTSAVIGTEPGGEPTSEPSTGTPTPDPSQEPSTTPSPTPTPSTDDPLSSVTTPDISSDTQTTAPETTAPATEGAVAPTLESTTVPSDESEMLSDPSVDRDMAGDMRLLAEESAMFGLLGATAAPAITIDGSAVDLVVTRTQTGTGHGTIS